MAEANAALTAPLGRLLAIAENYPQLKSNENFRALQDQLEGTENRISVARQDYNETVNRYNAYIRSEEHTSELQSHSDLVCRLLLEKKKKKKKIIKKTIKNV